MSNCKDCLKPCVECPLPKTREGVFFACPKCGGVGEIYLDNDENRISLKQYMKLPKHQRLIEFCDCKIPTE